MKKRLLFFGIIVLLMTCLEVFLRMCFGFCDTVLMQEDPDFEYIAQPNQQRFRFRNNVIYNSKSMRSEEVDTTAQILLGFGDSVINGGVKTDQDSLATTILSKSLSNFYQKKTQFLNISSGSWGPDNCYAYLKKHGDFNSKSIFLFVSSHDAYDNMDFEKVVDKNVSLPSKQYSLAIFELFDRYLLPKIIKKMNSATTNGIGINKKKEESDFNTGFKSFLSYTIDNNISFTIYLHADQSELVKKAYRKQGQKIINYANDHNIPIILDLEHGLEFADFRDGIHLNGRGQQKLANTIMNYIKQQTPGTVATK